MKLNPFFAGLLTIAIVSCASTLAKSQSAANNPALSSGSGPQVNFGELMNAQVGSMRFAGKVVVEGAKPLWDPIPIVVNCDGQTRYNTVADAKGNFDIQARLPASEVVKTKSDLQRATAATLAGCKVSAVLDGFESTSVTIVNGTIMDDPDIGTIHLRQNERAMGSTISATTASASADALKEFEKAHSDETEKHLDSARRHLQKAVIIDPQFAEAWYHLGKLEETDKPEDALNAYSKAVAVDPRYIPPYERIAALQALQKKWQDVVNATDHSLQLNPAGTPQIWYFSAVGNLNLGHATVAEKAAETSLGMDPSHVAPNTEQLLAVILAGKGAYKEALDHLRRCLTYTPPGPNADLMKQQVAQLERIVPQTEK
ncbi:MAG: tetratricopeptide repeat protein [Terracidiphilus sp.]